MHVIPARRIAWSWHVLIRPTYGQTPDDVARGVKAQGIEESWELAMQRARDIYDDLALEADIIYMVDPVVVQPVINVAVGRDQ